jgi:NADH-quinone oxidoreductase subunit G
MPTLKIDETDVPFEAGDTIIRAAWRAGIEIPHYCWHPGLSVAANCRMCLVEIKAERPVNLPILKWDEKKNEYVHAEKPKLQPACQTAASDGMHVFTKNDNVKEAQSAVQEFLLLNHPVDCPICDQAGECKLQDYWLDHQHDHKRKLTEPVHKPKGVRFGPTIVYDAERCIVCTRCIRVCDELAGDHVLDLRERSNKNEVVLAPGRRLDHRYSLMTEHVCPVGALTSRDFRFKARVWFLKSAPGVCNGCATGCNTHVDYDPRVNQVFRLRPRDNLDVNKYWMCDDGMMTYRQLTENRVLVPTIGRGPDREEVTTKQILRIAGRRLLEHDGAKVGVVLSAGHSTEDNAVLARLAKEVLGTDKVYLGALPGWEGDDILRHADNNPNRRGALLAAGATELETIEDLVHDALGGEIDGVIALGFACGETVAELEALAKLRTFINLTTNAGPLSETANIVVPVAHFAEMDGTFVNAKGLHQRFSQAIPAPGAIQPAWLTLLAIAEVMQKPLPMRTLADIEKELASKAAAQAEVRA